MIQELKKNVLVAGTLKSIADGGIVAYTTDLYDPNLKMTLSEINRFEGHILNDYAWKVMNKSEYDSIIPLLNVLYFLVDDDEVVETTTRLEGDTIITNSEIIDYDLTVTGTIENNTLTLL